MQTPCADAVLYGSGHETNWPVAAPSCHAGRLRQRGAGAAAAYGFNTSVDGIAHASLDVLDTMSVQEADDLGLTPVMDSSGRATIIDLLLTTDDRAVEGLLYDGDGDGSIDGIELLRRRLANDLYNAINEGSGI